MNEFTIIAETIALATNFGEYWIAIKFFSGFMHKRKIHNGWHFAFGIIFSLLLYYINSFKIPAVNTSGIFILVFIMILSIYKDALLKKAAFSIIFVATSATSEMVFGFIYSAISSVDIYLVQNQTITYVATGIAGKLILFLFVKILLKYFQTEHHSERPLDLICLSIFPALAVTFMLVVLSLINELTLSLAYNLFIIVLLIGLLASGILIFFIYSIAMQKLELEGELKLNRETLHMNEMLFRQQQNNIDELNTFKHDYKNHLLNIIDLYGQGRSTAALDYSKQFVGKLDWKHSEDMIDFDNFVLSNIFARLKQQCKDYNIVLTTDIRYRKLTFLDMTDTSTLFDNIFNNAVAACGLMESGQWIDVRMSRVGQYFVAIVKNSKVNKVIPDKEGFLSTHRCYRKSGYGIESIKKVVEKHEGHFIAEYTDDTFTVTIRMKISDKTGVHKSHKSVRGIL